MSNTHVNETSHARRATDNDKVLNIGLTVEKWFRLVWPILALIWSAFVYPLYTTLKKVPEIEARQQQIMQQQKVAIYNDSISIEQRKFLIDIVGKLTIIECFNLDQSDRVKYNLDKNNVDRASCSDVPLPKIRR